MKKDINIFIQEHEHINYCEAVISRDGKVQYVKPSHVDTLIRESGKSREEIFNLMDMWDSPIDWLVKYTGCVCVWSRGYMIPKNFNILQAKTLCRLIEEGLVDLNPFSVQW